uniref:Phosphatidate cytidylyltransferase, mitochondrial n=1 Tax=Trichobilharzia regenti TaxID=157069 RepID=A0AA85JM75_TRIRE|nr:unnamed protein product [Trichobilharzia regenti]
MADKQLIGKIKRLIDVLNKDRNNYVASFAYGSVVFPQKGRTTSNSLIDLIIIAHDPVEWHLKNISENPNHYNNFLRSFSKAYQSSYFKMFLCQAPGPKVYYNPFIEWNDPLDNNTKVSFKYGVVGIKNILSDLSTWSHLYIAGRLQKPVLWISDDSKLLSSSQSCYAEQLHTLQSKNLLASMSYAILSNYPKHFPISEYDLYCSISSISYNGDWRMIIGEDRQKIKRLVYGDSRLGEFRSLYRNALNSLESYGFSIQTQSKSSPSERESSYCLVCSNENADIIPHLLTHIPDHICLLSVKDIHPIDNPTKARECLANLSYTERSQRLSNTVSSIVRWSSLYQTGLGLISAGPKRSLQYAFAKLTKMFSSLEGNK